MKVVSKKTGLRSLLEEVVTRAIKDVQNASQIETQLTESARSRHKSNRNNVRYSSIRKLYYQHIDAVRFFESGDYIYFCIGAGLNPESVYNEYKSRLTNYKNNRTT